MYYIHNYTQYTNSCPICRLQQRHGLFGPSCPFGAFTAFWSLHGLLGSSRPFMPSWLSGLPDLYDLYSLHCLLGLPLICVIVYIRPNLYIPPLVFLTFLALCCIIFPLLPLDFYTNSSPIHRLQMYAKVCVSSVASPAFMAFSAFCPF